MGKAKIISLIFLAIFLVVLGFALSMIYGKYINPFHNGINTKPSDYFEQDSIYEDTLGNIIIKKQDDELSAVTTKGSSMLPIAGENDIAIVYKNPKESEIKVGDIIVFVSKLDNETNIFHRVIKITKEGYLTKGDNNQVDDGYIIKYEEVEGKLVGVLW